MSTRSHGLRFALAGPGRKTWLAVGFLAVELLVGASTAHACNIPVFRYALENWEPHPYQLVLFHEGPLTPADKERADKLQQYLLNADCLANGTFDVVDLADNTDVAMAKLWREQKNAALPRLVVRYPGVAKTPRNVYEGPFDDAIVKSLFDSPARRELARRLLGVGSPGTELEFAL